MAKDQAITTNNSNEANGANKENHHAGVSFGNWTQDPELAAGEKATNDENYLQRERGGTVVPELQTEKRMKELAKGGGGERKTGE
jgi:hypothetical protein